VSVVHSALAGLDAVGERLAGADPRLAALAVVLHVGNHVLRSVAWRNVLAAAHPGKRVAVVPIAAAYASGVALNAVAPARGGDALKVVLARRAIPGASVATLAATLSVLVAFDLVAGTGLVLAVGLTGGVPLSADGPARTAAWAGAHSPLLLAAAVLCGALAWTAVRRLRARLARLWEQLRQGGATLRTPARYLRQVAIVQTAAWCCRIGVILCLLAAFGLPATVPLAGLVMVLAGASTVVPLAPGGAGAQQVVLAVALSQTVSATAVVSFSLGMQAGVTAVNALLGLGGAMVVCRTLHPLAAVRGLRTADA